MACARAVRAHAQTAGAGPRATAPPARTPASHPHPATCALDTGTVFAVSGSFTFNPN